jgi:hypothetical protein
MYRRMKYDRMTVTKQVGWGWGVGFGRYGRSDDCLGHASEHSRPKYSLNMKHYTPISSDVLR